MDIVLIIFSFVLVLAGTAGCILPVLPGPPLAYVGLILMHLTARAEFSWAQLVSWLVLVVVLQVLDYITPLLGSKYSGGSEYGNRGCVAGTIAGLFFMPWGIILGPFIGAVAGEMLGGRDLPNALKAGFGTFLGVVLGVLLKLALCFYFLYILIVSL
mgnify:FL=1